MREIVPTILGGGELPASTPTTRVRSEGDTGKTEITSHRREVETVVLEALGSWPSGESPPSESEVRAHERSSCDHAKTPSGETAPVFLSSFHAAKRDNGLLFQTPVSAVPYMKKLQTHKTSSRNRRQSLHSFSPFHTLSQVASHFYIQQKSARSCPLFDTKAQTCTDSFSPQSSRRVSLENKGSKLFFFRHRVVVSSPAISHRPFAYRRRCIRYLPSTGSAALELPLLSSSAVR